MANILKPRRGKKSTAIAQELKLEKGEIFFEMPETGVGTGLGSIKFGDGNTVYRNLPYFFDTAAYAKATHTHTMAQVTNLNSTINTINGNIADIVDGTTKVAKAGNADQLNGIAASNYVTLNGSQALTNKTYNGYTLKTAAGKGVDENTTTDTSTNLPTGKAVSAMINAKIGSVVQIRYEVVEVLPGAGEVGVIYLVPHTHGVKDIYDEYIYVNGSFEKIGNTDIDLSSYALVNHTHNYQDLLNKPTIPIADEDTIKTVGNKLTGSRIKVLNSDPVSSDNGDMWILSLI